MKDETIMEKKFRRPKRRLLRPLLVSGILIFLIGAGTHGNVQESSDSYPFPPGNNAKLAKDVCTACHYAQLVIIRSYDEKSARTYYEMMVGDPDSEQGKKVIEYLVAVLGEKRE